MTLVAAIQIILKQLEAGIAVVSETLVWQCATHPITWLCLAWLCLTNNDAASKSCFQPCSREGTTLMTASSREWSSWEITPNFLTGRRWQRSRPKGRGEKKSALPSHLWPYDLYHQTWQHYNITLICLLRRTQMTLPIMSRESLVSGWVNPYLFYE